MNLAWPPNPGDVIALQFGRRGHQLALVVDQAPRSTDGRVRVLKWRRSSRRFTGLVYAWRNEHVSKLRLLRSMSDREREHFDQFAAAARLAHHIKR